MGIDYDGLVTPQTATGYVSGKASRVVGHSPAATCFGSSPPSTRLQSASSGE